VVARVEHSDAATHLVPPSARLMRVLGLAVDLAADVEHGIATQYESIRTKPRRDGLCLCNSEASGHVMRRCPPVFGCHCIFIHVAHVDAVDYSGVSEES